VPIRAQRRGFAEAGDGPSKAGVCAEGKARGVRRRCDKVERKSVQEAVCRSERQRTITVARGRREVSGSKDGLFQTLTTGPTYRYPGFGKTVGR